MPDDKIEINPNPQDLGDVSDAELDAALAGTDFADGSPGTDLEFGEADDNEEVIEGDEEDNTEVIEGEDDAESVEEDTDADDDAEDADAGESVDDADGDGEEDAESVDDAIPAAQRAAMEQVLHRIDVMEAEREQLNAKLEQAEILRDRNAGKLGSLMQKMENRDTNRADDSFNDDGADDESTPKQKTAVDEALAEIRQEKVATSVNTAAQDFYRANTEFFETLVSEAGQEKADAFQADLVARVTAANAEVGEEILTMSPKMAGKMAGAIIKTCFADMRVDLLRDFKGGASEKAEASRQAIRARKKGAAGTRSNKRPAASSTTKTKSLSQMSDKELDAALAQAATSGSFD